MRHKATEHKHKTRKHTHGNREHGEKVQEKEHPKTKNITFK